MVTFTFSAYSFEGLNSGTSLKIFNRINCGTSVTCSRTGNGIFNIDTSGSFASDIIGDGSDVLYGFRDNQVTGDTATTTLTVSLCGSTVLNATASAVILPLVSDSLGCKFTVVVGLDGSNLDITPTATDTIVFGGDAAGDSIRSSTYGHNITLIAATPTFWIPVTVTGTFTDVN